MIKNVTASEKKKLKQRLRKLDSKLCYFYKYYKYEMSIAYKMVFGKEYLQLKELDEKRKIVRNKLK